MVKRVEFWLIAGFAWAGFYSMRFAERVLAHRVVRLLLWLPAAAWGLAELDGRKLLRSWRRFPEAWRPGFIRYFLRRTLNHPHARLVYVWPDRLRSARWLARCRLKANGNLALVRDKKRGVILASLHFGPFETLPYWLRAHDIVATTLLGQPNPWQRLKRHQYSLSAPANVPLFLPVSHLPSVRQFLGPGGRPLVFVDVNRGKQIYIPFDNYLFRMATGAIRLAALADAELIPCLIIETASWHFTLHFGKPVPKRYLGRTPDLEAAAAHLLDEFLQVVTRYPLQFGHRLLSCISPSTPAEGSQSFASPWMEREDSEAAVDLAS
jgi:lauroyl/myristoyl acyltransferase